MYVPYGTRAVSRAPHGTCSFLWRGQSRRGLCIARMKAGRHIKARRPRKSPSSASDSANSQKNLIRAGRFKRGRLPEVEAFSASLPFDRRLYRHDIRGSIAHARMLAQVKLLGKGEAARIVAGLKAIAREI